MSPTKYFHQAFRNCEAQLRAVYSDIYRMPEKVEYTVAMGNDPEMDLSLNLSPHTAFHFMSITDVLR